MFLVLSESTFKMVIQISTCGQHAKKTQDFINSRTTLVFHVVLLQVIISLIFPCYFSIEMPKNAFYSITASVNE